jgi:hypothetical protein
VAALRMCIGELQTVPHLVAQQLSIELRTCPDVHVQLVNGESLCLDDGVDQVAD